MIEKVISDKKYYKYISLAKPYYFNVSDDSRGLLRREGFPVQGYLQKATR